VSETSEVVSKTIRDMQLSRDLGVIVLAIRKSDGTMLFNPPADTKVNGGDYLIVMGQLQNLRGLENLVAGSSTA
jgi:voltage-gated potassium channel